MRQIIISIIKIYQKTISPDHGIFSRYFRFAGCRYYPSCSEYAKRSVEFFGIKKGLYKTFIRLIHCHPFSSGGYDPVTKD